jgi:hypothetical protein
MHNFAPLIAAKRYGRCLLTHMGSGQDTTGSAFDATPCEFALTPGNTSRHTGTSVAIECECARKVDFRGRNARGLHLRGRRSAPGPNAAHLMPCALARGPPPSSTAEPRPCRSFPPRPGIGVFEFKITTQGIFCPLTQVPIESSVLIFQNFCQSMTSRYPFATRSTEIWYQKSRTGSEKVR